MQCYSLFSCPCLPHTSTAYCMPLVVMKGIRSTIRGRSLPCSCIHTQGELVATQLLHTVYRPTNSLCSAQTCTSYLLQFFGIQFPSPELHFFTMLHLPVHTHLHFGCHGGVVLCGLVGPTMPYNSCIPKALCSKGCTAVTMRHHIPKCCITSSNAAPYPRMQRMPIYL